MEYVHISTGVRVTSDAQLPPALYRSADEQPKPEAKPKRTRKRTTKQVDDEG